MKSVLLLSLVGRLLGSPSAILDLTNAVIVLPENIEHTAWKRLQLLHRRAFLSERVSGATPPREPTWISRTRKSGGAKTLQRRWSQSTHFLS
jgi:hypothetical protein